ncbi:MAG: hydrogenase nickel incorporation protein HypB [Clostridia bacterium]|nr:hydrogenase nickel incorporation protein HypB [Clostridia bacterium]
MEIKVVHQILEWNEDVSDKIKSDLTKKNVCLINLMGSPGAGKTSIITTIINNLSDKFNIGVIEGDIAGQIDAQKMKDLGVPVVQLNTDGACHIEAMSIDNILPEFDLDTLDVIFVENIGNLVCPAEFNIGEDMRIALLSIPEGDDKVEKYPLMFQTTDALVLNKYDMIEYFDFDEQRAIKNAKDINPKISIFKVSNKTTEGVLEFIKYLENKITEKIG